MRIGTGHRRGQWNALGIDRAPASLAKRCPPGGS
jgi:hypothetical protein